MKVVRDPDILETASFEEPDTGGMGVKLRECILCGAVRI